MNREEAERKMAEFNQRLGDLLKNNPRLNPDSPEVKSLIKEFNDAGMKIRMISQNDMERAAMNLMQMLSEMGMSMGQDDIGSSQVPESLDKNLDPCKYHKKGLDDVNRSDEISKTEVDNFSIDINTLDDEAIWKKYFGKKV